MKTIKQISLLITLMCSMFAKAQNNSKSIEIDNLKREDYVITDKISGSSSSNKVWILFIPVGGKSKTKRETKAYSKAISTCDCDGILQPIYKERRFVIPLIIVNFSYRKTTVSGKGYRIKTDAEKTADEQAHGDPAIKSAPNKGK